MFVIRILRLYNSHHQLKQSKTVLNEYDLMWEDKEHGLFMGGSVIMDLFITNMQLCASYTLIMDWSHGLLVGHCDVLISCFEFSFWWHPFTASYHWWANAKFHSVWWRNKLTYILDGLRQDISANFHFWVNYPFKESFSQKWKFCH